MKYVIRTANKHMSKISDFSINVCSVTTALVELKKTKVIITTVKKRHYQHKQVKGKL